MPVLISEKNHPFYGETIFKRNSRCFCLKKTPFSWYLYVRLLPDNIVWPIGKLVNGNLTTNDWYHVPYIRWYMEEFLKKVISIWDLENRSIICYNYIMQVPKPERDDLIVKLIDSGKSYREVSEIVNRTKSTVHHAYHNHKKRLKIQAEKDLSTAKDKNDLCSILKPGYTMESDREIVRN